MQFRWIERIVLRDPGNIDQPRRLIAGRVLRPVRPKISSHSLKQSKNWIFFESVQV
jgi:hypothetical protein